jgi:hypothetical protein
MLEYELGWIFLTWTQPSCRPPRQFVAPKPLGRPRSPSSPETGWEPRRRCHSLSSDALNGGCVGQPCGGYDPSMSSGFQSVEWDAWYQS